MAFMMPVVKNDWDIYNSQRSRRASESAERSAGGGAGAGRTRKVSESRSEGPTMSPRSAVPAALSPHRSAPAMRSLSYCRAPPSRSSRTSLRSPLDSASGKGGSSPPGRTAPSSASAASDKFHNRLVEKLKKALGRSESRGEERTS